MKWFLAVAGIVLVAALAYFQSNSVKIAYVNGLPEFNRLPGREFIFQRDCYIFKLKGQNSDWPLVGDRTVVPALPAEVTEKNLGADLPEVRILDVVRTGARFRLVSVRRDQSRHGTSITFEILFLDEADRKYARLDAFYLLDHAPEKQGAAPVFLENFAVARVTN